VIFFEKIIQVFCIINFKTTVFKGFTGGGAWVSPFIKHNFNRTQNDEVFFYSMRTEWVD
jgi:hypothetical protein